MDYQNTQSPEGQKIISSNQIAPEQGVYSATPEPAPTPEATIISTPEQTPSFPDNQNLRSVGNLVNKTTIVPETPQFEAPVSPTEMINNPLISPEAPNSTPEAINPAPEQVQGPEQIQAPEPAPEQTPPPIIPSNSTDQSVRQRAYRHENIRTSKDRLSDATLIELNNLEEKLKQDGNMASFYDDIRDAMESNLENSYNRKLGA